MISSQEPRLLSQLIVSLICTLAYQITMKSLFVVTLLHSFGKIQICLNNIEIFWIPTIAFKNSLFAGEKRTKQNIRLITNFKNLHHLGLYLTWPYFWTPRGGAGLMPLGIFWSVMLPFFSNLGKALMSLRLEQNWKMVKINFLSLFV